MKNQQPITTLTHTIRTLNALGIFVLMGVIIGAFYQEFTKSETPCPLCWIQRLGMTGIATAAAMNLKFGVRIKHYVLALFSAFIGGVTSARQVLLHICPGETPFGYPVLGLSLYTWAFLVFCTVGLVMLFMLFLFRPEQRTKYPMNLLEKLAIYLLVLITLANCVVVLQVCEFGPCPDPPWPPPTTTTAS